MGDIAIIGTGYVGLTTGACFAHLGHNVICADVVPDKVERLQRGEIPILEAGLEDLVREGLQSGRLRFVLGAANAVASAEFAYLCVPTPQGEDGSADLSYIEAAASEISPLLAPGSIVVNKSTVPVGSTRKVEEALGRSDVFVVSNPEFLREGSAVTDFLHPDRVVIGSDDQSAAIRVAALYIGVPAPLMVTDPASAETIKYASNAFLATKLSFVNAVAAVCEAVGADVNDVVLGMGYDKRIGHEFLRPGPGWGGSCFVGDETALVRRGDAVRLVSFAELAADVEERGVAGLEVFSWAPGEPTPAFFPVSAFTVRPYDGDVVHVRTKMGRRLTVTADHPFFVGDGTDPDAIEVRLAGDLTESDWLPVAQGSPSPQTEEVTLLSPVDALSAGELVPEKVIVRLSEHQSALAGDRRADLPGHRRRDILRSGTMRLHELTAIGGHGDDGLLGTVSNGTYVPGAIIAGPSFWHMIGLYLAEGHISVDGDRRRICWSFHLQDEPELVEAVADYWRDHGVKVTVRQLSTATQVSISSRVLAAFFEHGLDIGHNCYTKRVPDAIWGQPFEAKRALLRGLWDGDGSWSYSSGGPSVVLEYGTVSRALADGMLRLLGDLGIVGRLKVGRTAKSTVDTYWLVISGADQVMDALFLVPEVEAEEIRASIAQQTKRIRPTGYRRLSKGVAWVRVSSVEREHFAGAVYSLEVPGSHTVVTTHGLVAHNCFPKDVQALLYIAREAGYHFDLLDGVVSANQEQFDRTADKVAHMAGGSLEGKVVGVWGLSFKANTDDLRESPALRVAERLLARGATVRGYDPSVKGPLAEVPDLEVVADAYAAVDGADVLAVLTEWDEFKWVDLDKVGDLMKAPRIVDARNLLDRSAITRRGFAYQGIGRA